MWYVVTALAKCTLHNLNTEWKHEFYNDTSDSYNECKFGIIRPVINCPSHCLNVVNKEKTNILLHLYYKVQIVCVSVCVSRNLRLNS